MSNNEGEAILTLYFSEAVDITDVDPTSITILAEAGSQESLTLGGGSVSGSTDQESVSVVLTVEDTNALKLNDALATGRDSAYLSVTSSLVTDLFGNAVETITEEGSLQVTTFTEDTKGPQVVEFALNMDDG